MLICIPVSGEGVWRFPAGREEKSRGGEFPLPLRMAASQVLGTSKILTTSHHLLR